jgi:hypothetical protein
MGVCDSARSLASWRRISDDRTLVNNARRALVHEIRTIFRFLHRKHAEPLGRALENEAGRVEPVAGLDLPMLQGKKVQSNEGAI